MVKEKVYHLPFQWSGGNKLLFLHDKLKKDKLQEQTSCPIPRCSFCQSYMAQTFLFLSQDGNMEYSSDFESSDMTVVIEDDAYKPEEDDQSVPLTQTQQPDTRPKPFKGVYSAAEFTSRKETSVGTRNNVLLVSRPWKRQFFTFQDKSLLVYCNIIFGLIK